DHDNAARLAAGLDGIDGVRVLGQHTNMVFAEFDPARCESLTTALRGQGILMRAVYGGPTRLVTHLDAERAHHGTAFQWFRDDGVLALLPMPDTADGPQVFMVWSMRTPQAQALQAMEPAVRAAELERLLA
ncbi:hypothetical protein OMF52_21635, partial [Bordetella pertussis]